MAASDISTFGNYLLIERLHLGDKGETFVAREADGKKGILAVKRLLPQAGEDKEYVANFLLMAHLAAPLKHEAICQIEDFGSLDGSHFVAREYVGGKDLRDLQRRHVLQRRLIPDEVVLFIGQKLCDALVTAHNAAEKGDAGDARLYADADPRNVLVGFAGEVKLIGFGLQPRKKGDRVPPDVRQFGATLYELLTGKAAPAENESVDSIPPPDQVRSSVSKELSRLAMQALGASGGFASVVELKEAFEACAGAAASVGSAADLSALMKRIFAGALRIEKERARRVSTVAPQPQPRTAPAASASAAPAQPAAPAAASAAPASQKAPDPAGAAPGLQEDEVTRRRKAERPGAQPVVAASGAGGRSLVGYAALAAGCLMLLAGGVFYATAGPGQAATAPLAPDTPAQLQVVSEIPVDIIVDEGEAISTPLDQRVKPGAHGLTIVFPGTQKRLERQIELKAGETVRVSLNGSASAGS